MSSIRVLVGTRKGAFTLTADGKRENWHVDGPFFAVSAQLNSPPSCSTKFPITGSATG
jgi:hypothetical protein